MSRALVRPWFCGALVACALTASGCGRKHTQPEFTTDVRIDGGSDRNDPDSFGTEMCLAGDRNVYVLWMDDRDDRAGGSVDIWMNRSTDLGARDTWLSVPIKVNQGAPDRDADVWNPDLYCNEVGAFVVWEDDRDGVLHNHQIYANRWLADEDGFLPEDVRLDNDPTGQAMSLEPKIAGRGDDLFVTWYDGLHDAFDIYVATSSNHGDAWRPPTRVDTDPFGSAYSARPEIAVSDDADDVWIAWEDSRDDKADIYTNHSANGGTTFDASDERLDEGDAAGAHDSFEPQICTDGGSNVYVVWHDTVSSEVNRDIYYQYSGDAGDEWRATAQRLETQGAGYGNSLFPVCVADGNVAHVTWYDQASEGYGYDILYRDIASGSPMGEVVRLDVGEDSLEPAGYANSVDPHIAMADGYVAVAWSDYRNEATAQESVGYDDLYYNYSEDGGPFREFESGEGDLRIDSMYSGTSFKQDVNFDLLGGSWFAAWTDGRAGTSDVYFQTLPIGTASRPPTLEDLAQSRP